MNKNYNDRGAVIWITGLSGVGKTTLGKMVYKHIKRKYPNTVFVDGDSFRKAFVKNSGHSVEERREIARQISGLCQFLSDQNIHVVCATISLFNDIHKYNRENIKKYFDIFVECEMDELVRRDKKGLYSKALSGKIKNVVGVDLSFDKPEKCMLILNNTKPELLKENVNRIIELIKL